MKLFDYDDSNIESVLSYAKKLEGMTFNEILDEYEKSPYKSYEESKTHSNTMVVKEQSGTYTATPSFNRKAKGQLGNLLEKYYFGYEPNGNQEADFNKIGVELKQTPIDVTKKGEYRAGERLSITNISYNEPIEEDFYQSHVWEKIRKILLIHYLRDKSIDRLDYTIKFINLFTPPKEDLRIIIDDYNQINEKIKQGRANELSEGDTMYLGACTKGATAKTSMRPQYYGNHTLAKKRNFCFKSSYMNYILKEYVLKNKVPSESIMKDSQDKSFKEYVLELINNNVGLSDKELCKRYDRTYNNNKAQWTDLAFRMLGIKSNQAAEFDKANIKVKTIRIEENGKNNENMPLPTFKFKEFVDEEWEDSKIFNYLDTTQFLFVVFQREEDHYILKGARFWHMPYKDLHEIVFNEWIKYQETIKNGVKFTFNKNSNGGSWISNNLPGMRDTEIIHMRPHSQKAAYRLNNGYVTGNINRDADQLPNGEWMTRQSFWLNKSYVLKQLKELGLL